MKNQELELLEKYSLARKCLESLKEQLSDAQESFDNAEKLIVEYMQDAGKQRTATYDNLGFLSMGNPRVYASCVKDNQGWLFNFLKEKGRDDLIKPTVHHTSLSSLVQEMLTENQSIPQEITYFLKPTVKFYAK